MKKALLTFIFIIAACVTAQAQAYIGGSVKAQLNKDLKSFTIAPDVGYSFAGTPFSVGCALEYQGSFTNDKGYTQSLTVSPSFIYNICDIGERFTLFAELCSDIEVLDFSFFDIGLSPGISFDLTEHWSAEFSYGFLGYKREAGDDKAIRHNFVLDFKTATAEFTIYYNF